MRRFKDVKVEVTINGSGFDTPSAVKIEKADDIPSCNMTFPGGTRSRYKVTKKDILKVYIGLDDVPDHATFTGFQEDESGTRETKMELWGALHPATKEYTEVTDLDNFDGVEISNALESIKRDVTGLSTFTTYFEKTSPVIVVPNNFRFTKTISKYDLMKQLKDLAVDPLDPLDLRKYVLFDHDSALHFRKMPNPDDAEPSVQLAYGDSLLNAEQESTGRNRINKQRVIGNEDDSVSATFSNAHRIATDGILEGDPIVDNTIPNNAEAFETARSTVLSKMIEPNGIEVRSHLLLDLIPNFSVIEITGAPYGLNDKYLLRSLDIDVRAGQFDVVGIVNTPSDVISDAFSQLLNLNRDLAFS